jgi:hypothetical protein
MLARMCDTTQAGSLLSGWYFGTYCVLVTRSLLKVRTAVRRKDRAIVSAPKQDQRDRSYESSEDHTLRRSILVRHIYLRQDLPPVDRTIPPRGTTIHGAVLYSQCSFNKML